MTATVFIVRAKRWIQLAKVLIFFPLGSFSVAGSIFIAFTGYRKANGESADDAIIPLAIIGSLMLLFSVAVFLHYIALGLPLITANKNGLKILAVGYQGKALTYIPGIFSAVAMLFHPQTYRVNLLSCDWQRVYNIQSVGIHGYRKLIIEGEFFTHEGNGPYSGVTLQDASISLDTRYVVDQLLLMKEQNA